MKYKHGKYSSKSAEWLKKGIEQYQKEAVLGISDAQTKLGNMYRSGNGLPKDGAKAVEWYERAGVQGDASALESLGDMYERGEGIPKDTGQFLPFATVCFPACNMAT